jgi:hypothetical protein
VIGEVMRPCGDAPECRCPELMVEVTVMAGGDDGGDVHACVSPTLSSHADGSAPSSDPMSYISLYSKLL